MNRPSHFFNIESADQLFNLLKTVACKLAEAEEKSTEDFLLLIFGLAHLREWIAPSYKWRNAPSSSEECFYQEIWELEEFRLINGLCNRSKHMCLSDVAMGALYETTSGSRVLQGYFSNGHYVEDVIRNVIRFYENNWFSKNRK